MVSACGGIYRKFCKYFTTLATVNLFAFGVCSTCIWNLQGHINSLERVQKFELKVCTNTWSSEYESLLQLCDLPTLASRRHYMKLCLLYQVLNGHLNFSNAPIVPWNLSRSLRNTSTLALERLCSNSTNAPYTITLWNSLPLSVQNCQSLHSLKRL